MTTGSPRIIAHSGFKGVAPANSLAAVRAIAAGTHPADMIEIDVMPCGDGTPVVFHDSRLGGAADREGGITDVAGYVWETPLETVQSAKIYETEERVPTLEAVLDLLPPEIGLNIELKNPGVEDIPRGPRNATERAEARASWEPFVSRVVSLIEETESQILFSSFYAGALAAAADHAPDIPRASLPYHGIEDALELARRYDCSAIGPRVNMVRGTPYFEQPRGSHTDPDFEAVDIVQAAHDMSCEVYPWIVRTWREADRLVAAGVDGLIADYPGLLGWNEHAGGGPNDDGD